MNNEPLNRGQIVNLISKMVALSGLQKKDIAKKMGIFAQNISRLEKSYPNISLRMLIKMASALGYKLQIDVVGKPQTQEQSCSPSRRKKKGKK
jgi:transcriptional regulator with XRE-family HTH domain